MADDKKKESRPEPAPAAPAAAPKRAPLKVILLVAGLMAAEAGAIFFLVGMGGRAQTAKAEVHGAEHAEDNASVEIPLLDDKFQNMQTGRIWMWDIQIALKIKKKHEAEISEQLAARENEIKEGVSQIIRRAQHGHLREADLVTVNRQVTAYLDKVLGPDAEGKSRIERVLIPKCKGFQLEQ